MSGMSGSRGGKNSREKKVKKSVKPVSTVSAAGGAKTGAKGKGGKGAKIRIPELLAPAGSPEALKAAVCAGADAVYLSGRNFGARRFAANFNEDELKDAVEYCHTRGVRVYVTLNTLISDEEMPRALSEMMYYYSIGADAVLVQDLGLLKAASECFPDLVLHHDIGLRVTLEHQPGALLFVDIFRLDLQNREGHVVVIILIIRVIVDIDKTDNLPERSRLHLVL